MFATWWQGVGIALLRAFGVIPKEGRLQTGLQDFLICIEVSPFSSLNTVKNSVFLKGHSFVRQY